MKILPQKIHFNLNTAEMQILLQMLERKILDSLSVSTENLIFNYLVKFQLNDLRIKIRHKLEVNRIQKYKLSMSFTQAISFYAAFGFGTGGLAPENMLANKLSTKIGSYL